MDTPDLGDIARQSIWPLKDWTEAWDAVRTGIPGQHQEAVWTTVRNLVDRAPVSPRQAAFALVPLLAEAE